ncbi:hypothetical protein X777_08710 [Ooceraea biroi]|uniref:Uncharacterized protein n=1 Tax=Ooceraea biroi TaxID=2015173 RepID=A0A026W7X0_OOCBI|nr:hypothetical protein X777_08710 [Ooceraea biroi]
MRWPDLPRTERAPREPYTKRSRKFSLRLVSLQIHNIPNTVAPKPAPTPGFKLKRGKLIQSSKFIGWKSSRHERASSLQQSCLVGLTLSYLLLNTRLAKPGHTSDYPSLSTSTSIQTHSRRKLSWRDLGSEAKTRAFLPRKYGSEGVPRATPTTASRHLPEDIRRKAKENPRKNLARSRKPGGITGWLGIMGILKLDYQSLERLISSLNLSLFTFKIMIQYQLYTNKPRNEAIAEI